MCIRELNDQFEIQGAFCIKAWKEELLDCIVLASGSDFECDRWDIDENILERKISYMYAVDGVLNIELEWD